VTPAAPSSPASSPLLPATGAARWHRLRRALRRRVLARRRLLAALCCGVAAAAGVHAVAAPPPETVAVVTAAHDLPAGTVLAAEDLTTRNLPPEAVPDGAAAGVDEGVGETLAAPLRSGEPVTDVRLVGSSLADAHPDLTTLPVRLPDAGQVALLAPGDRIDLVATDPRAGGSRVVATDAVVLAVPPDRSDAADAATPGALVVLGVTPAAVPTVSEAAATWFLSYAFSH
jgi:Flp pilus assembly protein CpaB